MECASTFQQRPIKYRRGVDAAGGTPKEVDNIDGVVSGTWREAVNGEATRQDEEPRKDARDREVMEFRAEWRRHRGDDAQIWGDVRSVRQTPESDIPGEL